MYPDRWQAESLARQAGLLGTAGAPRMAREAQEALGMLRPWTETGRKAALHLRQVMDDMPDIPPLTSYLAVLVQDLDGMGLFLGGRACDGEGRKIDVTPNEHGRVSQDLLSAAARQSAALRNGALLGIPVYAGGDDLLAFTPASKALAAAQACHDAIPLSLPRASTAVLFFHYHASIQQAMSAARKLLDEAKERVPDKHALAVGYLRRSGVREASIQPWAGRGGMSSAELFGIFGRRQAQRLSPRLVTDLERDADELASLLGVSEKLYRAELARLVRRHAESEPRDGGEPGSAHGRDEPAAEALDWLGRHECAPEETERACRARPRAPDGAARPHVAARVGVFLRQEAR